MTTLTDFLLARISEDEAWWRGSGAYARDCQECAALSDHEPNRPTVDRLLTECEAKRQAVAFSEGHARWSNFVLRALAAVYADHPDYRPEWRP